MATSRQSAGLLLFRLGDGEIEVLLVHPGGPFFQNKDEGAWSIPKGEVDADEGFLDAAIREFKEETGVTPQGPFHALPSVKQKGGKLVHAWACKGDCDPDNIQSNTFSLEWPPKSGRRVEFPEVDRAAFLTLPAARKKINAAQRVFLDALEDTFAKKTPTDA